MGVAKKYSKLEIWQKWRFSKDNALVIQMDLWIDIKKITIGTHIKPSKRLHTYSSPKKMWCPSNMSKILRHLPDSLFNFMISKKNRENKRFLYIYCSICQCLIFVIQFDMKLTSIIILIDSICIHIPTIKKILKVGRTFFDYINILGNSGDIYLFLSDSNPFSNYDFTANTKYQNKFLRTLCFVAPWAQDVLKCSVVLEIDS